MTNNITNEITSNGKGIHLNGNGNGKAASE